MAELNYVCSNKECSAVRTIPTMDGNCTACGQKITPIVNDATMQEDNTEMSLGYKEDPLSIHKNTVVKQSNCHKPMEELSLMELIALYNYIDDRKSMGGWKHYTALRRDTALRRIDDILQERYG